MGTVDLLDSYVVAYPDVSVAIAKNLSTLFTELLYVAAWTRPEPEPESGLEGEQMNVGAASAGQPPGSQVTDEDVQMGDEIAGATVTRAAAGPGHPAQPQQPPQQAEGAANGEGEGDDEPGGVEERQLPEWLAGREFWEMVDKQIATFALLRSIGIPMDLS